MGDPKYPRRAWRKPKRPLNYDLKMEELKTLGTFGLRTKRELWKAHTKLSTVRHQARSLLALQQEVREQKEPILMKSLARIGLVSGDATLDDVLNLQVTDLLTRRLQTLVWPVPYRMVALRQPVSLSELPNTWHLNKLIEVISTLDQICLVLDVCCMRLALATRHFKVRR